MRSTGGSSPSDWSFVVHAVLLAAVLWHVVTWFEILPKTMPKLILRGLQLPQRQVTAMARLVALVCSAALLIVVVALGAMS